ncbi:MAG: hypothetical protein ACJAYU_001382 [Bradymonadia bacterium]|jgi:hypothetical protein
MLPNSAAMIRGLRGLVEKGQTPTRYPPIEPRGSNEDSVAEVERRPKRASAKRSPCLEFGRCSVRRLPNPHPLKTAERKGSPHRRGQ